VKGRWWLVPGLLASVALAGALGYTSRSGDVTSARSGLAHARASNERLASELERARTRYATDLGKARAEAAASSAYGNALLREFLSLSGARGRPAGFCSSMDFPKIHIRILSPAPRSNVKSPVVAHLIIDRPLGCASEYYLSVDGVFFEPVSPGRPAAIQRPVGPHNPDGARPAPASRAVCFGGVYEYVSFHLAAGPHVLAVAGGCARGTEVPQPTSEPVHFTVTGSGSMP
jgi:hypothetical protein